MSDEADEAGDSRAEDGTVVDSVVDLFDGFAEWYLWKSGRGLNM